MSLPLLHSWWAISDMFYTLLLFLLLLCICFVGFYCVSPHLSVFDVSYDLELFLFSAETRKVFAFL